MGFKHICVENGGSLEILFSNCLFFFIKVNREQIRILFLLNGVFVKDKMIPVISKFNSFDYRRGR